MQLTTERQCIRCCQPLADGLQFCHACGCNNECLDKRLYDAIGQADERIAWARWMRGFHSLLAVLLRSFR
jgi:hypothetical protein